MYPGWARFVGALIIMLSTAMIPIVLITRLVAYQSARDEGKEFIFRVFQSAQGLLDVVRRYTGLVEGMCGGCALLLQHLPFPMASALFVSTLSKPLVLLVISQ